MNVRVMRLLSAQINSIVSRDPVMLAELSKLDGSEVSIEFLGLGTGFVVTIAGTKVALAAIRSDMQGNATISASVLDFMYIMKHKNTPGFVLPPKVKISGNGEEAVRLMTFLSDLNINWERHLSVYIGDLPSHMVTKVITSGIGLLSDMLNNTKYNIADFVTDEMDMVPTKSEVDEFCQQVTMVSDSAARLEARLSILEGNK